MVLSPYHDESLLADTPTGRLRCILWAGSHWVVRLNRHDESAPFQLVHEVKPGEGVLDAIYGKAFFEQDALRRAYAKHNDVQQESKARANEDHRRDTRKALKKFLWRHDDAGAVLRGAR